MAVIVAEDVTSRLFNVIRWCARAIPLMALQVTALESGAHEVTLVLRSLNDTKHYIGLARNGIADNYVRFRPVVTAETFDRYPQTEALYELIEAAYRDRTV